jgi:hypothetical protein
MAGSVDRVAPASRLSFRSDKAALVALGWDTVDGRGRLGLSRTLTQDQPWRSESIPMAIR